MRPTVHGPYTLVYDVAETARLLHSVLPMLAKPDATVTWRDSAFGIRPEPGSVRLV